MSTRKIPTIPPRSSSNRRLFVGLAAGMVLVAGGCGRPSHLPELGYVSGTVRLDGRPVVKANVAFEPSEGRPSLGITDAQGLYTLQFAGGYGGAIVGRHTVRIGTEGYFPGADGGVEFVAESLPATYNTESTLAADVQLGRNRFDFDLSSQPAGSQ
jgi:hypothetical protein